MISQRSSEMTRKLAKKRKMWDGFIPVTMDLIEEEGFDHVTIREIDDRAGYNSATLYNYFGDLSHLLFFASMKLLTPYVEEVKKTSAANDDLIQNYIDAWELFCTYSFEQPKLFYAVFIMDLNEHPDMLMKEYYEVYSEELSDASSELQRVLYHNDLSTRGFSLLHPIVNQGLITLQEAHSINEMTNFIWKGVLSDVISNRNTLDKNGAKKVVMNYANVIVELIAKKHHLR